MDTILSLVSSVNWSFVAVCVVMSLVFGSIWFHPKVLGTQYARWMKLPTPAGKMPEGMGMTFVFEIVSRILYFTGLVGILSIKLGGGSSSLESVITICFYFWLFFVFPTQLSQLAWTNADKKAIILLSGNTLIQTMIAGFIWDRFFW